MRRQTLRITIEVSFALAALGDGLIEEILELRVSLSHWFPAELAKAEEVIRKLLFLAVWTLSCIHA